MLFAYDVNLAKEIGTLNAIIIEALKTCDKFKLSKSSEQISEMTGIPAKQISFLIKNMIKDKIIKLDGQNFIFFKNAKEKKVDEKEELLDSNIRALINSMKIKEETIDFLIEYRKSIGKPFTKYSLLGFLKDLLKTKVETKKTIKELIQIMCENGWKTIKPEYIKVENKFY